MEAASCLGKVAKAYWPTMPTFTLGLGWGKKGSRFLVKRKITMPTAVATKIRRWCFLMNENKIQTGFRKGRVMIIV
ncbi:TPA: hypothetical protein DIU13_04900 [Candidatus Beckwithbacteria bacterium]|nr:hypothetical protein [Candidatus Beckwithbacteria bacterium]